MNYIMHFCKNKSCNNCWLDEDLTNAKSPVKYKYCMECCKKYGYINPNKPPISKKKREQLGKARSKIEKRR